MGGEEDHEGAEDHARAQQAGGDDDDPLLQVEADRHEGQGDGGRHADDPHQEAHVEADGQQQAHRRRVPQAARNERHGEEVEEVRQHGKDRADDEAHHPTGHGGEEASAEQHLHRLGAEHQAEEEAPDGQQDEEEAIAAETEHQAKHEGDQAGAGHSQEGIRGHDEKLLSECDAGTRKDAHKVGFTDYSRAFNHPHLLSAKTSEVAVQTNWSQR